MLKRLVIVLQKQQRFNTEGLRKYNVKGPVATIFTAVNTGSWRQERPVVDFEKCIKCGICVNVCPVNIVKIEKGQQQCIAINLDYCKGCGICANECPKNCICMVSERGDI